MAKGQQGMGKGKYVCGDKGCRFSTSQAHRMEHHRKMSGHGKEQRVRQYAAFQPNQQKKTKRAAA